ncbi:MAG: ComC/BlpC family leader-containing pheromone/bacteriocin [Prolixibacteraceae bacterium]|nr:ComC/BlpC family leader-containing pheromone/bacteriocin [Prolixibacteraceae bacterium]
MKRSFITYKSTCNFNNFELLTTEELLKVRGGSDLKPASRPKDIFDLDGQQQ